MHRGLEVGCSKHLLFFFFFLWYIVMFTGLGGKNSRPWGKSSVSWLNEWNCDPGLNLNILSHSASNLRLGKASCVHVCMLSHFSCVQRFATLWTVTCQASLSMRFSRKEYCSGLPRPPPGDFSDPGIEPMFLMSPALARGFFPTSTT